MCCNGLYVSSSALFSGFSTLALDSVKNDSGVGSWRRPLVSAAAKEMATTK